MFAKKMPMYTSTITSETEFTDEMVFDPLSSFQSGGKKLDGDLWRITEEGIGASNSNMFSSRRPSNDEMDAKAQLNAFFSKATESTNVNSQENNRFFQAERSAIHSESFVCQPLILEEPGHTAFDIIEIMLEPYRTNMLSLRKRAGKRISRLI